MKSGRRILQKHTVELLKPCWMRSAGYSESGHRLTSQDDGEAVAATYALAEVVICHLLGNGEREKKCKQYSSGLFYAKDNKF